MIQIVDDNRFPDVLTPDNVSSYKKELLDFIEYVFEDDIDRSFKRCYILPNGKFVSCIRHGRDFRAHWVLDTILSNALEEYANCKVKSFSFDCEGISIFDLLGCIRVNGEYEDYILLPENKITSAQQTALEKWINWFFYDTRHSEIIIETVGGYQIAYSRNEYTPEEIMQKINRYYNTGNLYENKKTGDLK